MIKHIVCFKLHEPTETACHRAEEVLLSMIGNVPGIREIQVGVDFLRSARSYDVCLSVVVDDKAALEEYDNDPYHCNVVKTHMRAVCASSITVDFEF
ncbi:MAG: Dabb family protein [Ruminococcaceae bacterium]|nr:Dabb family protein [Oscillospiraceae bacterium]